ncbi:MAG: hypothetical protein A2W72_18080 [Burkholderiales bacterium RIFCSPLOWO2_12_67_14]|nr:MAG: hypothetical protein A3I64_07120 [Burkholderiales bacterium RIFCSPLOWO2_02_FULL_67_64]OGB40009.1 MAG: hypothetical protein A3E51_05405 [Burkholderiales bacterium RIFCSPHIGHO2_12_FULL_67_38]OGB49686.1 MAG: hypothetical protein A2W72_18080 [Burkholderiales bacterium RIFCSPLOWO2_12_67_14]OGB87194.1 MAG: hypothetical protein A3G82_19490 [Burkholderiales bacterium RIFCSPLOWO2_12_FULL_67_210]
MDEAVGADMDHDGEKYCHKCNEWWPADGEFFFLHQKSRDGLWYCCKACYYEGTRPHGRPVAPAAERLTDVLADRLALSWVETRS